MKKCVLAIIILIYLFSINAYGQTKVKPMEQGEVISLLSGLNDNKIFLAEEFSPDKPIPNQLNTFSGENGFFISGSPLKYFAYTADINNDGKEEYLIISYGKTKRSFRIIAVYKKILDKYADIFWQVEKPISEKIKSWLQEQHPDQQVGFRIVNVSVEKSAEGLTYLIVNTNNFFWTTGKWQDDIIVTYKFLWDNKSIDLIRAYWNT